MDPIGHDDRLRDLRHTSSVPVTELFCSSRNIWVIALFLMSSTVHACLAWSTRQPILLQCTVHSTCHNLARARIFNPVPCQNQATKPAVWCDSECSHKCFNERSSDRTIARKSSIEGFYVWVGGDILKIYENNGFIMFHISILGSWSFVWLSRLPMTTRLGPEQLNDEGALEFAHEICDWNG